MSIRTKLLIAGRNGQALEELASRCELPAVEVAIKHINNGHADPLYGVVDDPDLLIFHAREDDVEELQCLVDRRPEARPTMLVVGPAGNARLMKMAMQAGARDYLEEPVQEQEFQLALDRILQEKREQSGSADGSLMAVVSAKGGAGASFLAVNLAHILATQSKLATTLLDLDLQFGSLAQYLDLQPKAGLMRAIDMADSLDAVAADACMVKHPSSLGLLAPKEDEIILSRDIPTDGFSRLLQLLKQSYERVVVDLPRQIDELSATVYEQADNVLVVVQQELACLRDAARLRSLLTRELGIPPERVLTVVNRYEKSLPVELDDICQGLGISRDDISIIPNHYRSVAESINVGVPMTEHARTSVVTKSLMSLGSHLGGSESDGEPAGIFSRTFQLMRG